jgi:hypothetical protein
MDNAIIEENDNCISCGKESHYGIVSINVNKVLHQHYCKPCYFNGRKINSAVQTEHQQSDE